MNQPINAGAKQRRDISGNNSPALARNPVDPANLVVANRIDLPRYSCALHVSFNGGAGWEDVRVPFPEGEEDPPRCYAPDVAYAPDGTLHLAFVTLKGEGNVPNAVWTVSSKDGGRSLTVPVKAGGPLAFQVQLTADPTDSSRLYLHWLQALATGSLLFPNTGNPIVTSTSVDGGATWSLPARVTPESRARAVAPSPAIGPHGEMFVLYHDLLEDRLDYAGAHEGRGGDPYNGTWALVLARSADQGASWKETVVDDGIVPTERFIIFLPPTPSIAVDPKSGRIYAGFTDGRLGDADVDVWTSSDGGKSFGSPVRVNDTPLRDRTSQYMPSLAVAPGGRLDVLYFDRRADPANLRNEVSLQSSFNNGRSFTRSVRVTDRSFDSRIGQGSERGLPDLGNRLALVSTTRRALAVWPDTRAGSEVTGKQDLASAVVDVPPPSTSSRSWLRVLGGLSMALGVAALALTLVRRRPPAGTEVEATEAAPDAATTPAAPLEAFAPPAGPSETPESEPVVATGPASQREHEAELTLVVLEPAETGPGQQAADHPEPETAAGQPGPSATETAPPEDRGERALVPEEDVAPPDVDPVPSAAEPVPSARPEDDAAPAEPSVATPADDAPPVPPPPAPLTSIWGSRLQMPARDPHEQDADAGPSSPPGDERSVDVSKPGS